MSEMIENAIRNSLGDAAPQCLDELSLRGYNVLTSGVLR